MRAARVLACFALLGSTGVGAPAAAEGVRYRDPVFEEVRLVEGLAYGSAVDNSGVPRTLELDLYEPEEDTQPARPAIVFAHGGGFTGGSRADPSIVALADAFARRGYVTVSIGYRTRAPGTPGSPTMQDLIVGSLAGQLPGAMHDAQHDMQAAVRWLRANAETLAVASDAIVTAGISAGASMALETAFNPEDPGESGNPGFPSTVSAALSISGATDPRRIEPGAPPVMLFNGTHDFTAPFPTAVLACGATMVMRNVCELEPYVGSGHDLDPHRAEIIELGADFLCRHVLHLCDP